MTAATGARPEETRVRLEGEIDLATAEHVAGALRAALDLGARVTVVDLSDVTFMDSTGLRILMQADARARDERGTLRMIMGPESVRRVFRLARLQDRLEIVDGGNT